MDRTTKHAARVAPLPSEHSPELREEFASFMNTLGFVPNSVLTMQRKPPLVEAFVHMQKVVWSPQSKVDRGLKRLIAHVASRAAGDPYSMAHTASGALHFGISDAKLAAVPDYQDSPYYNEAERSALDLAVAASKVPNAATDAMFTVLRNHWSEEQIVEIVAVIATTGFVNRWNTTMATPLEEEPRAVGEKHLAAHGWAVGIHG